MSWDSLGNWKVEIVICFQRQNLLSEDAISHTCQVRSAWSGVVEEEHNKAVYHIGVKLSYVHIYLFPKFI
jgi:hypothetical protein